MSPKRKEPAPKESIRVSGPAQDSKAWEVDWHTLAHIIAASERQGVRLKVCDDAKLREKIQLDSDGRFLLLELISQTAVSEVFPQAFNLFYANGYWLSLLPGSEDEDDKRMLCIASSLKAGARKMDGSSYGGRFALRLRMLRDHSKLSVDDIVNRMEKFHVGKKRVPGVQAYYGWEQGTACPHLELLPALAKALEIPIRELLPEK